MSDTDISPKIIYIAGTGRNGSTVIGNILAETPDIVSVGELKYLWRDLYFRHLCGCGKEINSCEFWREVVRKAFGTLSNKDLELLMRSEEKINRRFGFVYHKSHDSGIMELVKSYKVLYAAIQLVSGRDFIVDTSKTPLFEKFLISRLSYPVYTIHLIRDPRATSYSWNLKKDTPDPTEPFLPRLGILSTSFNWVIWNLIIEAKKNKNYLRLHYEDLTEKPQSNFEKIIQFVKCAPSPAPLFNNRMIQIGVHHTVSGNPARFRRGALEIKLDERWKHSMPIFQKMLVFSLTWPLFLKYYYLDKMK